jgi:hypothetical protein
MQDSGMKKYITIVILFLLLAYPLVVLAAHYTQSYNFTRQKTLMISSIPVFTIELHAPAIYVYDLQPLKPCDIQNLSL